jgi:hypothetical protein
MIKDIEACPVFARWQVECHKCGITFYVDIEPEAIEEDILNLEDMECELHPIAEHVLELA